MALGSVEQEREIAQPSTIGRVAPVVASKVACSVGVMAVNEEANIGNCLTSLLNQRLEQVAVEEILVVVSGSTDNTAAIVEEFSRREPRVQLLAQARREGKASAVNLFLQRSRCPVFVIAGADTILAPDTLEQLCSPFVDPEVGMTGGRPIPSNDPNTFMGFAAHLLWGLHHQIALQHPKLGELIAVRRVFHRIPGYSAVDEASIETLILGQAFECRYVPEAAVFNRGPETVADFLKQRRRIHAGHCQLKQQQGYQVSTMKSSRILACLLKNIQWELRWLTYTPAVIALEVYGRLLGWWDFNYGHRDHTVWEIATSTKKVGH